MEDSTPGVYARILVLTLAVGYLALLLANTCFFAAGTDTSGYLNEARLIAAGRMSADVPILRRLNLDPNLVHLFTPYGFARGPAAGTMVPTYPTGLPLHLALAALIGGWEIAPFLVSPLMAMACLVLFVAVARKFDVEWSWAIAGAASLAAYPVFILHALQPMSDVVATFWVLLSIWCAVEPPPSAAGRRGRRPYMFAIASGIAFAVAVAVRPTNLLLAIPLAFALRFQWRRIASAAAAALPFGAALMWYHATLYGSPWKTGYGGAGDVVSFGTFPPCLDFHFTSLATILTPIVMPAGLLAIFDRGLDRTRRGLLASWFLVFFVFYSFYSYCPGWASARFLLPAVPALIIGVLRLCAAVRPLRFGRAIAVIALVIVIGWEVRKIAPLHALHINDWDSIFPRTVAWTEGQVPSNATVLSNVFSGVFYYHSGRITPRWDQLDAQTTALLRAADPHSPWYAVVGGTEGGRAELARHVPGDWVLVGTLRDVTLWRLPDR